ncbi:unnamed protein product, partial [Discosporangium mesarthrocarpum]
MGCVASKEAVPGDAPGINCICCYESGETLSEGHVGISTTAGAPLNQGASEGKIASGSAALAGEEGKQEDVPPEQIAAPTSSSTDHNVQKLGLGTSNPDDIDTELNAEMEVGETGISGVVREGVENISTRISVGVGALSDEARQVDAEVKEDVEDQVGALADKVPTMPNVGTEMSGDSAISATPAITTSEVEVKLPTVETKTVPVGMEVSPTAPTEGIVGGAVGSLVSEVEAKLPAYETKTKVEAAPVAPTEGIVGGSVGSLVSKVEAKLPVYETKTKVEVAPAVRTRTG